MNVEQAVFVLRRVASPRVPMDALREDMLEQDRHRKPGTPAEDPMEIWRRGVRRIVVRFAAGDADVAVMGLLALARIGTIGDVGLVTSVVLRFAHDTRVATSACFFVQNRLETDVDTRGTAAACRGVIVRIRAAMAQHKTDKELQSSGRAVCAMYDERRSISMYM
jgi:hypothetical protein